MIHAFAPREIRNLRALHDTVLVSEMNFQERITTGGIVLPGDNGKNSGIRQRWGCVYAVGPKQTWVRPGDWICVAHGRWTRGVEIDDGESIKTIRKIDPNDILLVSDELPSDDTMSDAVLP